MLLMSKGSKGSKVVFVAYIHNIDTFNAMLKGLKVILTFYPFDMLRHTLHWMVWLERSKSQLSKTFLGLKIA